jgi:hypothetical protein
MYSGEYEYTTLLSYFLIADHLNFNEKIHINKTSTTDLTPPARKVLERRLHIATCMSVTIDGVWTCNWIYWVLTERNYK